MDNYNHTRRLVAATVAIVFGVAAAWAAGSAESVLAKTVSALHRTPSVTAGYVIASGADKSSGRITVEGSRFFIDSKTVAVWYDGKTQWTLVAADREVSITEPTAAEISQINPFAVIDSWQRNFKAKLLKSAAAGKSSVELTPRNPKRADGVAKAVLTVDNATGYPERLVVTRTSRQVVTITLSSVKGGSACSKTMFAPSAARLRGLEVVDLR